MHDTSFNFRKIVCIVFLIGFPTWGHENVLRLVLPGWHLFQHGRWRFSLVQLCMETLTSQKWKELESWIKNKHTYYLMTSPLKIMQYFLSEWINSFQILGPEMGNELYTIVFWNKNSFTELDIRLHFWKCLDLSTVYLRTKSHGVDSPLFLVNMTLCLEMLDFELN